MKVLMITGDKNLLLSGSNAHQRLTLQRGAVEQLDVVYWGRDALWDAFEMKGNYDVISAQDPLWRGLVAWYVARKKGAKLNIQVHMDLAELSFSKHILSQIVLRHATSIRVVSQKIKNQVERVGVRAKITLLPVFVDLEKFRILSRRAHEGKNILWIGRFEEEKNPLAAIRILKAVLKSIPDTTLTMLGEGSMSKKIASHAAHLPVNRPGWQDPAAFFSSADVVLCTSLHESFGASIIEALAAGVPVVAPDVGVAKEAGAIVVEREKLAEAVIDVLKSDGRGVLQINLLPAQEWAREWRDSLI